MTSGGTESILSAIKASRDYMAARKGIRQPEMVIGVSAHAAYWKVRHWGLANVAEEMRGCGASTLLTGRRCTALYKGVSCFGGQAAASGDRPALPCVGLGLVPA